MNLRGNTKGFSLIMALMAIAILGAVALGVATLFASVGKKSRHMNSVAGSRALISTLQGFTSYANLCIGNLDTSTRTMNPTLAATNDGMPLSFRLGGGATGPKVQGGATLPNYDVVVDYLNYRKVAVVGADMDVPGNRLYSGELVLKLKKIGDNNIGGNDLRERGVGTLVVSANIASGAITGCYAVSDAREACKDAGGTYDDASNPKCKLRFPCEGVPNAMFMGYDADGKAQCKTMGEVVGSLCNSGEFLTADGAGGVRCVPVNK